MPICIEIHSILNSSQFISIRSYTKIQMNPNEFIKQMNLTETDHSDNFLLPFTKCISIRTWAVFTDQSMYDMCVFNFLTTWILLFIILVLPQLHKVSIVCNVGRSGIFVFHFQFYVLFLILTYHFFQYIIIN